MDPRIGSHNPVTTLALRQQQDDEITPARSSVAAQVHASTTPVVPYHFGQSTPAAGQAQQPSMLQPFMAEVKKLAKMNPDANPAEYARSYMGLEGKILNAAPDSSYRQIQQALASHGLSHPAFSGQAELEQLNQDLAQYLLKNEEQASEDGGFKAVFDKHVERVGDTLGFCHSLYDDALAGASEQQQQEIKQSRAAFSQFAAGVTKSMTEELPGLIDTFLEARIAHAKSACEDTSLSEPERQRAGDDLQQLMTAKDEFSGLATVKGDKPDSPTDLAKSIKGNDVLNTSLNNIGREKYVAKLKAESGSAVTAGRIFTGQGIPQGGASYLHFGYTRSSIDERMQKIEAPFAGHVAATAAGLGTSHKVVSDAVRPFLQLVMDQSVGLNVAKVDPLKTYPKPLGEVAVNGQRVKNSHYEQQSATQEGLRKSFKTAQNANYFGTASGDFTGFTSFGGSHAVRDLLDQFTELNAGSVHARALFSGLGGTVMAGTQAVSKYLQTHGDEKIPTHTVVRDNREFLNALSETFAGAKKQLDPTQRATYNDLAGRILSLSEGVAMSTALSQGSAIEDDASVREKIAHTVATYFQSGLTLQPFFANNQAAAENKAIDGKVDNPASRAQVPWQNLAHPDRASLPHSQPAGTPSRMIENAVQHVPRAAVQAGPQLIIAGANAAADKIASAFSKSDADEAGTELSLAEQGRLQPKNTTGAGGASKTTPS